MSRRGGFPFGRGGKKEKDVSEKGMEWGVVAT